MDCLKRAPCRNSGRIYLIGPNDPTLIKKLKNPCQPSYNLHHYTYGLTGANTLLCGSISHRDTKPGRSSNINSPNE